MKVPEFEGTTMLAGVLEANASTDALMSSRIAAAGNLQASAILLTSANIYLNGIYIGAVRISYCSHMSATPLGEVRNRWLARKSACIFD